MTAPDPFASLTFEDAEPVAHARPGRAAAPNPFTEIMKSIAGKVNPQTGKPVAKTFTINLGDPSDKEFNKLDRLVSRAGVGLDVRVNKSIKPVNEPNDGTYTVTFWTTPMKPRGTDAQAPDATGTPTA